MEFLKPEFALEFLVNIRENFPKPLVELWGDDIIRGSGQKAFDAEFLPKIAEKVNKPSIIAFAQDLNYEPIVKSILKSPCGADIRLVLRAPIDINLTKELNILCKDLGFNPENIIMDTDTGCVGMGLDYGYSIIERLKIAKKEGDEVLNPPIIVFSGEESFKSKESKSDDFKDTRGSLKVRSCAVEIATSTALLCAGADIIVCQNPRTIEAMAPLVCEKLKPLSSKRFLLQKKQRMQTVKNAAVQAV